MRFFIFLTFLVSCVAANAQTSASTFSWINQNILTPKCAHCHSGLTYAFVKANWVQPLPLLNSPLFADTSSKRMPQDGPALSPGEMTVIGNWIKAGAPNN